MSTKFGNFISWKTILFQTKSINEFRFYKKKVILIIDKSNLKQSENGVKFLRMEERRGAREGGRGTDRKWRIGGEMGKEVGEWVFTPTFLTWDVFGKFYLLFFLANLFRG